MKCRRFKRRVKHGRKGRRSQTKLVRVDELTNRKKT